ncbi:serine--tRNA ligase [Rubrivirga sp. S365]|uniref:serine--tRNA ligase n=1 Tax=Rubrivirga sp. S365 TaxID=3076080 RepID=UPI0028C9727E|nr:serine--tRNA ligase [Rubrivirga sp. S365]MDT7857246.1 serine--tRNA ligase [Rubrivirga sp. S365]
MLDLDLIRDDPDRVRASMEAKRIGDPGAVDRALDTDRERREAVTALQALREEQGAMGRQIGPLMKSGKRDEAAPLIERSNEIKQDVKAQEEAVRDLDQRLRSLLLEIPNVIHESVPVGGEDANEVAAEWGERPQFDFEPLPHWELAEKHGLIDFERGAKVSGAGFPFYVGQGARLQRALIALFLDLAVDEGYTEVEAPVLVNEASGVGTGQLPDKEGQMYEVRGLDTEVVERLAESSKYFLTFLGQHESPIVQQQLSDDELQQRRDWAEGALERVEFQLARSQSLYLVPTAEVPLTNFHRDEVLDDAQLPLLYTGYTPCFRREAGSYGKDVRGLNRLHQFDKVELVRFVRPDESYRHLEMLREDAERAVRALGLPYRRLVLASGDLGVTQAKTYDLEVWSAGQDRWLEVSSVSNFESFQARRANVRYRPEPGAKPEFVHTLNGSALALPRIVAALLENGQQADGSVVLPARLAEYAGFDRIG